MREEGSVAPVALFVSHHDLAVFDYPCGSVFVKPESEFLCKVSVHVIMNRRACSLHVRDMSGWIVTLWTLPVDSQPQGSGGSIFAGRLTWVLSALMGLAPLLFFRPRDSGLSV